MSMVRESRGFKKYCFTLCKGVRFAGTYSSTSVWWKRPQTRFNFQPSRCTDMRLWALISGLYPYTWWAQLASSEK